MACHVLCECSLCLQLVWIVAVQMVVWFGPSLSLSLALPPPPVSFSPSLSPSPTHQGKAAMAPRSQLVISLGAADSQLMGPAKVSFCNWQVARAD